MTAPRLFRIVALVVVWAVVFFGAGRMVLALTRPAPEPAPVAYAEGTACSACPDGVLLNSVQVENRRESTLFLVRGAWLIQALPAPGSREDFALVANDVVLVLRVHTSSAEFEIITAKKGAAGLPVSAIAASLRLNDASPPDNVLLINVTNAVLKAPLHFHLALMINGRVVEQLPSAGDLFWDGTGRPHK